MYNTCKLNSLYLCCLPLSICHGICLITLYQTDYNLNCKFTKIYLKIYDIVLQGFVFQTAHRTAIIHPKYSVHDSNYTYLSSYGNANQAKLKNLTRLIECLFPPLLFAGTLTAIINKELLNPYAHVG